MELCTKATPRHLPLVDILIDTQAEFQELVVASGLKVLEAMLDEDRAAVCGPRYAHQPARQASRTGHTPSQVVLGGRKVAIRRPRARRAGEEVPLPTARAFANADPLNRRVVDQMLIGVATRQYARSLEPLGADVTTRGTSKRAVSRRFVAQTQAQLDAWRATPLDALDLVGLLIDGVHVGGHCIVVALAVRGESPTSHRESSDRRCAGPLQGETREYTGSIRPRNNTVRADAAPAECSGTSTAGC